jgi:hypothetical protein
MTTPSETEVFERPAGEMGEVAGTPGATSGTSPQRKDPSAPAGSHRFHGTTTREITAPHSSFVMGPFGRMFRKLAAWVPPGQTEIEKDRSITKLAETMFETDGRDPELDNPAIPAGYTYFGQFVDHDITFDPASSLTKQNDPNRLHNFRTPRFDLDNLYGEGPDDEPFLYQRAKPWKFLIGRGEGEGELDLPRNAEEIALIGDKRNDENIIVAQLQLAFLLLHNTIYDRVEQYEGLRDREAFTRTQELVRWHYQHVVLFDFLPRICGEQVVREIIDFDDPDPADIDLKFYRPRETAYMPVEFSVAAYRLGHSMIRGGYALNSVVRGVPLFVADANPQDELVDLRGFRGLPPQWTIDWRLFLDFGVPEVRVQPSRKIDAKLAGVLRTLQPGGQSLAELNLRRGFRMGLPSGQSVARAMKLPAFTNEELGIDAALAGREAPLWLYILKEAEKGGGKTLGPVGGRIVAEVFVGLARHDPNCFLNVDPGWTPRQGVAGQPLVELGGGRLELKDLLRIAGRDGDPF